MHQNPRLAEIARLVEQAEQTKSQAEALSAVKRVVTENPDPDDPALRLLVLRAYKKLYSLTPANPPEEKEQVARAMLACADASDAVTVRRQAAALRFHLTHTAFFLSNAPDCERLTRELLEKFRDDKDPEVRKTVAQTRWEFACAQKDPAERRRKLEANIRDYRDSDDPDLARIVVDSAYQVYVDVFEEPEAEAICRDMLNRYGGWEKDRQPNGLRRFVMDALRRFSTPEEQIRGADSLVEQYISDPKDGRLRINSIRELLHIKAKAMGVPFKTAFAPWCHELAEKCTSPGLAALLLEEAVQGGENEGTQRREIVDRFAATDDRTAATLAARSLTLLALRGDCSEAMRKRLDDFFRANASRLPQTMRAALLLAKAEAAPGVADKMALYDQVMAMEINADSDPTLDMLHIGLYEEDPRFIAAFKKYSITGDAADFTRYLDVLRSTTGRPPYVLFKCEKLLDTVHDPKVRQALYAYAAAFQTDSPGEAPAQYINILSLRAKETSDPAEAAALYEEAITLYKKERRAHWLFLPKEAMLGLLDLATDKKARLDLLDSFLQLARENSDGEQVELRLLLDKAELVDDTDEKRRLLDEVIGRLSEVNAPPGAELGALGQALLDRAELESEPAARIAYYDRILAGSGFFFDPLCMGRALRRKSELLADPGLPAAYAREYMARKIVRPSARKHVREMAGAFESDAAEAMIRIAEAE